MSGILCAGDVYFDRLDDAGQSTGIVYLFDAKKFAITEPTQSVIRESRGRDDYGQAKDVVYIKSPATLAIEADEVNAAVLGLALMGDVAALTQADGTVTDAVVGLKLNASVQLPHVNINAVGVVLTNAAGDVTYVEGTDYSINRRMGWMQGLSAGAVATDNKLSYAYSEVTGSTVTGGSKPVIRGRVILDGINLADQSLVIVDVPETRLAPTGELDFASGAYARVALSGLPRTLPGQTGPYTVTLRAA
ncbi:hypothetical protein RM530_03990 [Algiphilus sp. W345]|uniref:Major tail protein n=1 Tax=Banduia mediterranea TaxID=3075609 RepID=A0ABU2WFA4_9GAMM|nr:hypothetical protein [Algiphilus sp. W345]MDT0496526.1 hypothetical protein [Algiphilus sp. W345]